MIEHQESLLSFPLKQLNLVGTCHCGAQCGPGDFIASGWLVCDTHMSMLLAKLDDIDDIEVQQ